MKGENCNSQFPFKHLNVAFFKKKILQRMHPFLILSFVNRSIVKTQLIVKIWLKKHTFVELKKDQRAFSLTPMIYR